MGGPVAWGKDVPSQPLRILGVHGLGDHRSGEWIARWRTALRQAIPPETQIEFYDASYDHIMEQTSIGPLEAAAAIFKLVGSGIASLGGRERAARGFGDRLHFTAGYVCAWVEDTTFQRRTRQFALDKLREVRPNVILAHSLGSLITYNAFSHEDARDPTIAEILRNVRYVTIGSQIGNPFVMRNLTPGRIEPLNVEYWHHVFNKHDNVFTAQIRIPDAQNFKQTRADFDTDDDHKAETYIGWPTTIDEVWGPISERARGVRGLIPAAPARPRRAPAVAKRQGRRALLIGINDYPNPADRLEGCINDVFQMSAVLQECSFAPESIRTCLNERATAEGILQRMEWLLEDPRDGDERVFYYSGHGARMPEYGQDGEPDHHVEALVPYDFDWTPQRAVTDDKIYELYSQLPYDSRLMMIFDCCHSGGIHRDGAAKARGISPPDDIRHRELKWDSANEMWVSRDFKRINTRFSPKATVMKQYFGEDGATRRLGRASMLRGISSAQYKTLQAKQNRKRIGPYLPLIIEACGEKQYSYEYRHGVTSYGAFTYSLTELLRARKQITFATLVKAAAKRLAYLQYDQVPQILGPTAIQNSRVPWAAAPPASPSGRVRKTKRRAVKNKVLKTARKRTARKRKSGG